MSFPSSKPASRQPASTNPTLQLLSALDEDEQASFLGAVRKYGKDKGTEGVIKCLEARQILPPQSDTILLRETVDILRLEETIAAVTTPEFHDDSSQEDIPRTSILPSPHGKPRNDARSPPAKKIRFTPGGDTYRQAEELDNTGPLAARDLPHLLHLQQIAYENLQEKKVRMPQQLEQRP
ncbi:hypothetical protein HDU88_003943 [Geranomyces variabilis]|nr:hypothetical protein HDU88_003943 [Geranomyces variabilis]